MHRELWIALLFVVFASAGCGDPAVDSADAGNGGANSKAGEDNGTPAGDNSNAAGTGAPAPAEAPGMALDASNTKITFVGTKPDGTRHEGGFKEFTGTIGLDQEKVQSITAEIQTASLWSDAEPRLTNHLKSPDFFNVQEHPTAKFESTSIEGDAGELTVTGNLTLLGKTEEITFPAQATVADGKVTLTSEFQIDRSRFGMDYGQGQVDNDVTIQVNVGSEAAAGGE